VSQIALSELLQEMDWPEQLAELVSDAVGCHHGERASPNMLSNLAGDKRALGRDPWTQARRGIFEALRDTLKPAKSPDKQTLSGPDFMLLSGLTSFSDWVGSNEARFPFGIPADCEDLSGWFQKRRVHADKALDAMGWAPRTPLSSAPKPFGQVFGFPHVHCSRRSPTLFPS
jgi:CRISPR-associated endonuclease/helicase Cas3